MSKVSQNDDENKKNRINEGGVFLVEESRTFYKDSYRRVVNIALFEAIIILLLLLPNAYNLLKAVKPYVIAVNPSMQVQPLVPLSEPMVSNAGASAWTTSALEHTFSLSFTQWRQQLSNSSKYYTSASFKELILGLKSSGILEKITGQRLNTVMQPISAMYVQQTGVINGIPVWAVKGKMLLTYQGSTGGISTQNVTATVIIERANILKHPSGLLIRNISLQ